MLSQTLVCFPAYVPWKTPSQLIQVGGSGDEPQRVFEELGKISPGAANE